MPFAEIPGASLYYEIHGTGPWLVLAHGAGGNSLSWWQQVPAFAGRFRCLVYDQAGFGRSTCEGPPSPARLGGDLVRLLDHVGAERAALVGQSMGGWTVLGCALADPRRVTHLVLTGTLAGLTDGGTRRRLAELHPPGRGMNALLALAPDFPRRDPARSFLFERIAALNPPLDPAFVGALIALRHEVPDGRLTMPIIFIAGERDQLFPPDMIRRARARLPGADLVIVPEAGHSVYFERPEELNVTLAAFLGA
jgi:3-oxoadipate enol-lactonase